MDPGEPDIAATLLRYLQRRLERPDLAYAQPLSPIALGTEASIFGFSLHGAPSGLGGPLVLRVMFSADDADEIVVEHAVQNAVAQQGFPAPFVVGSSPTGDGSGRPFMVMTRLPGEHRPDLPNVVDLQMEALAQLHTLDPEPVDRAFEVHGVPFDQRTGSFRSAQAAEQIGRWGLRRLWPLLDRLERHVPAADPSSICHGDPHLANMLFLDGVLTAVLDWGTVRLNCPEMDVGLLCGYARCGSYVPSPIDDPRQQAVDRLIAAYDRLRPVNPERVLYFETEFLASALVDMTERHIRRDLGETVAANPLLDDPGTADLVRARLETVMRMPIPSPEEAAA